MPEKKKIRNDQEWLDLIQECRTSGLSDREWYQMHSISINTFYNKVSDLRKKAYEIPKSQAAPSRQRHEVVPIELACSPVPCPEYPAGDVPRVPTAPALETVGESYPRRFLFLGGCPRITLPRAAKLWTICL
ncbi:hypothetical protein C823_000416 [Eubacterium plexicaudatum ASF492]|uniref:Uncharacterized protein n=1 Tax=Eubacterium plexicaudatum ASF492 TaxID=1235802 RepID=N2A1C1_9FIRM|nr:hypothetical protein C823_000416 [Eubacterium plexicaudatum ASF492]